MIHSLSFKFFSFSPNPMKRYFQTISRNNYENGVKKRRVFQPLEESSSVNSGRQPSSSQSSNSSFIADQIECKEDDENISNLNESLITSEKSSSVTDSSYSSVSASVTSAPTSFLTCVSPLFDTSSFLITEEQREYSRSVPKGRWIERSNLLIKLSSSIDNETRNKGIVTLDLDGTLIVTKSGKTFPADNKDWKLFNSVVPSVLQEAYQEGYSLAIISNQKGNEQIKERKELEEKLDTILSILEVPIDIICSHNDDIYRKPRTGMWEFLYEARWKNFPSVSSFTKENCFYIGDAAGRPVYGGRKKDFSDTDYKFALNLGITVSASLSAPFFSSYYFLFS
jgi:DNA 3'-phosphatase